MAIPRRSTAPPPGAPGTVFSAYSGYADVSELERYKLISNIGKGSFGVISKVQRVEDGREFALKQLDYSKMSDKDRKQILAEVAILEGLKHRNIVQLVQKIKDPKNERIYIVMEYCQSGDLGGLIRKAKRANTPLNEDKIWNIFLQIVLALHHCHWPTERAKGARGSGEGMGKYQVLHRDLKPENVFMSDDFVKLGDFGLSKDMGNSAFTDTYVGTPLYMPPEILSEARYDTKSDMWSLGCLIFEMCTFSSPFATASTQVELIHMVKSGKLPPIPPQYSPALGRVIKALLNLNPTKRPSTKDLLEMDEIKLHRKLFTVQNQTALLMTRKAELEQAEERLRARSANLSEREKQLGIREAACAAREQRVIAKEGEVKITQEKFNTAAEALRTQWDRLREEKDRMAEKDTAGVFGATLDPLAAAQPPIAPSRPPLEERHTLPTLTQRPPSRPTQAWEDTPSKIPVASHTASPVNSHSRPEGSWHATPIRRTNTKSLNNLRGEARAQAAAFGWSGLENTPAKQNAIFATRPAALGQRISIGSPDELDKAPYCEDISMASPMPMVAPSPGPFLIRPRKSAGAPGALLRQAMHSAAAGRPPSSASSSSQESHDVVTTSSAIPNGPSSSQMTASTTTTTHSSTAASRPATQSFVYKEAATPAKWMMEDPDLPSPFLRRPSVNTLPLQPVSQPSIIPQRQPLGAIQLQETTAAPTDSTATGQLPKKTPTPPFPPGGIGMGIPRSKSGTLHQQVLRTNARAHATDRAEEVPVSRARMGLVGR